MFKYTVRFRLRLWEIGYGRVGVGEWRNGVGEKGVFFVGRLAVGAGRVHDGALRLGMCASGRVMSRLSQEDRLKLVIYGKIRERQLTFVIQSSHWMTMKLFCRNNLQGNT